jgi:hypothetical protein
MEAPIAQSGALPGNAQDFAKATQRTAQSALSSAFLVTHVFKLTRIWAGDSFNGSESQSGKIRREQKKNHINLARLPLPSGFPMSR